MHYYMFLSVLSASENQLDKIKTIKKKKAKMVLTCFLKSIPRSDAGITDIDVISVKYSSVVIKKKKQNRLMSFKLIIDKN